MVTISKANKIMAQVLDYPELPQADDPRWRQAHVLERRQRFTTLRSVPEEYDGYPIQSVYCGDLISIIREIRYGTWIAAMVGYRAGWLNLAHLKPRLLDPDQYYTSIPETTQDNTDLPDTKESDAVTIATRPTSMQSSERWELLNQSPVWLEEASEPEVPQELLTTHSDTLNNRAELTEEVSTDDVGRVIKFLKGFVGRR